MSYLDDPTFKYPIWLPEWARTEYAKCRKWSDRPRLVMTQIIQAQEMETVWPLLERRRQMYSKLYVRDSIGPLANMSASAYKALTGYKRLKDASRPETMRRLADIKKFAAGLRASLTFEKKHAPHHQGLLYVWDVIKKEIGAAIASRPTDGVSDDYLTAYRRVAPSAKKAIVEKFTDILLAIESHCEQNLSKGPMVGKLNLKNADRLYFLKKMRRYFESVYGQPLHETNLKLASVFFDTDNLTPNKVATITKAASLLQMSSQNLD